MQKNYLGIDVSKLTFDACLLLVLNGVKSELFSKQFSNDAEGLKQFKKWLESYAVTFDEHSLLVIENTGIYHRLLWQFCSKNYLPIYIGNAADLKHSFGTQRTKNDKTDAELLCKYCFKNYDELKATPVLNSSLITLKDLLSNRSKLICQKNAITQTINELKISNDKATQKLMQEVNKAALEGIKKSVKLIEAAIAKIIKEEKSFQDNFNLLLTVPGIGNITAAFLICCTNNFSGKISGKQLASYAGVVPFEHSSGTSVKKLPKVHFMANKELKSILTMGGFIGHTSLSRI
jgi:transposase